MCLFAIVHVSMSVIVLLLAFLRGVIDEKEIERVAVRPQALNPASV